MTTRHAPTRNHTCSEPLHAVEYPPLRQHHTAPPADLGLLCTRTLSEVMSNLKAPVTPFAGRLGGNQEFIVNRDDPANAALIEQLPDAAPLIPWRRIVDLRGLREVELWKAAVMEGVGTFIIVFTTAYIGLLPDQLPAAPTGTAGIFGTAAFFGPLIGGITNIIVLTLLIYSFSSVSGAHLNPLITIGTLFARLTSLPRALLYVTFQVAGAALGGLMLRAAMDSRSFLVGGCYLFTDVASVSSAVATEFMGCLTILFLAFGVGLDPRQSAVFGPALAPALVGLALGVLSFGLSFARPGYGGASMNPARCFGVYVATSFPGWHWYQWVAAVAADIAHGLVYALVPPWTSGLSAERARDQLEKLREQIGRDQEHGRGGNGNGRAMGTGSPRADHHGREGMGDIKE